MKKRTYVDKPLGDTEWLLEQWGSWRMDGMGVPRYVSPLYAMIRDNNVTEGGIKNYCVTDDVAVRVAVWYKLFPVIVQSVFPVEI